MPYSVIKDGNATLSAAGTPQKLTSIQTPCAKLVLSAGENNGGDIVIGGATVVGAATGRRGATLVPNSSVVIEIDDLSKIWFDGTNTGDTLNYFYVV